ncbi:MAG TPA: hypothetical protein VEZ20_14050 [Allosphingosinicella sp.]|nr:hypothetical protein [Allosphingosinicella sp.]
MTSAQIFGIIMGSGGVSGLVTLLATKWLDANSKKRTSAHQARLVSEHLENFAFGCAGHSFTNYTILVEQRPGVLISTVPLFPPFSDKIEWTGLNSDCVDAARRLDQNFYIADAQTRTAFGRSPESGFRFAFSETLRLGNEALEAASTLRATYKLKQLTFEPPRWDWVTFLRGELEKLDLRREQITVKAQETALQKSAT